MGAEFIPDRTFGQRMKFEWINVFRLALIGNLFGRGISGSVRANYSRLGSDSVPWKQMFIKMAYLDVGDVFPFYDYAGQVDIPQGWMFCNGAIVNEANYDSQHSSGDWDSFVVSSVISGKHLPDMNAKYPVGETATLQSGASAITSYNLTTNIVNIRHDHDSPLTSDNEAFDNSSANGPAFVIGYGGVHNHNHTVSLGNDLSLAQNIEPEGFACRFIMRVV